MTGDLIERLMEREGHISPTDFREAVASLRTALATEREARQQIEQKAQAAGVADGNRISALEHSLAEARRLLKPFADAKGHFDSHVRDDDTVEIALRDIRARHVREVARFLAREQSHG